MLREPSDDRESRYLASQNEIVETTRRLVSGSRESIAFLVPASRPIEKNAELLEIIARHASQSLKTKVRILVGPMFDEALLESSIFSQVLWRKIDHNSDGVLVFDRKKMTLFNKQGQGASLVTSEATLQMTSALLDALWKESELRETGDLARRELIDTLSREERLRRQAQLLQDILTHDIRNYNQVTRLSAELLKEELDDEASVQPILDSIIRAIDGSTEFLERAKRLGRAISEQHPLLYPVNLIQVIEKSLHLIRNAYPKKEIQFTAELLPQDKRSLLVDGAALDADYNQCNVRADDLLGEVFSNIFSNSAKYTDGSKVEITVRIEDAKSEDNDPECWKVTIIDAGHGIPDKDKANVFSRYLRGAKGIGLGMSIIHALVVDRYGGRISLKNRVEGDHTQGTVIEIFLKKELMKQQ